jgi:Flp pilus assembly protein TadG
MELRFAPRGMALAEFAVALPLLVVLVYGIFDFGGAFNLKQKLDNAAREGARYASTLPTNDLDIAGTPNTISSVQLLVDAYLIAAGVNDCGLAGAAAIQQPPPALAWKYTVSGGGCPAPLTLTIDRSDAVLTTFAGGTPANINVICSRVTLTYGYQWQINHVIQLVAPGGNFGLATITADATAPNMD